MPDHRGGRDVDPSEFIDVFKFAGVQFGKWLPQDERQKVMNLAFDGLMDLAWVMGVPPGAIGFGKRISVAFGARGGGGTKSAHYEAEERIFNFTRFSGAGNVAHEWAHAYDHVAGEAGLEPGSGGIRSGTGWHDWTRGRLDATAHLGEAASAAWDSLVTSLRVRPLTRDEAVEGQRRAAEGKRRQIAMREAAIEACLAQKEEGRPGLHATRERQLRREIEELLPLAEAHEKAAESLRGRGEGDGFGKAPTTFLQEALLIGGGKHGYWTRPNEMFARAFEAVAYDRVVEAGGLSDYLVHGVDEDTFADKQCHKGNPYPTGAEREALRRAYAGLFDAMRPCLEALAEDEADLTDAVMVRP